MKGFVGLLAVFVVGQVTAVGQAAERNPTQSAERTPNATAGMPLALEGFCPVTLSEQRAWKAGSPQLAVIVQGHTYFLADEPAKQRFDANPSKYVPVFDGDDLVAWFDEGTRTPGDRRHGVFFGGRVYLFTDEQHLATFSRNPNRYEKPPLIVPNAAVAEQ